MKVTDATLGQFPLCSGQETAGLIHEFPARYDEPSQRLTRIPVEVELFQHPVATMQDIGQCGINELCPV